MLLKISGKRVEFRAEMIMANRFTGGLPDMLLGIEVRRTGRQKKNLQARVGVKDVLDARAAMPSRPIPKQEERTLRISRQEFLQEDRRGLGIHHRRRHHRFLSRV